MKIHNIQSNQSKTLSRSARSRSCDMSKRSKTLSMSKGFSAVELLITLFIAAAFLICGYQLYDLIIKDSGETRTQARASNLAYDYLQQYKLKAENPCNESIAGLPNDQEVPDVDKLSNVRLTVAITCPYDNVPAGETPTPVTTLSKVSVTITYGTGINAKTVNTATYVTK